MDGLRLIRFVRSMVVLFFLKVVPHRLFRFCMAYVNMYGPVYGRHGTFRCLHRGARSSHGRRLRREINPSRTAVWFWGQTKSNYK